MIEPPSYDGPGLSESFPVGDRVITLAPFAPRAKVQHRGWIVGYAAGLIDLGSPESGPGPVEEADLIVVRCDDGRTRRFYAGLVYDEQELEGWVW